MDKKEKKPISDKIKETFSEIKDSSKLEEVYEYSRSNIGETATYVALTVGLLLSLFGNFYGPPIIGFVAGLYFAKDFLSIVGRIKSWFEGAGVLKASIIGATLLALFIQSPMFFIGAAAAIVLRRVIVGMELGSDESKPKDNNDNSNN